MTDAELIAALDLRELDLTHAEALQLSTWRRLVERDMLLSPRERASAKAMLERVTA